MEVVCIFPHHLFENHPGLKKGRTVFLIEDCRFFSQFHFHKKKLVFHRACLKNYQDFLEKKGYSTIYIEGDIESIFDHRKIETIYVAEIDDIELEKRVKSVVKKQQIDLKIVQTPLFLTTPREGGGVFKDKKHYSCDTF
ncbi:MAG: cryptochrome/photolyase family protein, partial [Verrucomicrobia bacterium]|nr:cryptochrome/photolyase family protein [Verrucomicrobiota bacterium]